MKLSGMIKAVCWSLVAILLCGIMFNVIHTRHSDFFGENWSDFANIGVYFDDDEEDQFQGSTLGEKYHQGSVELEAELIDNIDVDWIDGNITIKRVEGDKIKLSETSTKELTEKTALRYRVENQKLSIRYAKGKKYRSLKSTHKNLVLEVPKELSSLVIDTVSSDMVLNNLTLQTLSVDKVSGKLTTSNVTSKTVEYETVSGDVDLNGSFDYVDGDGVSGAVTIISSICPRSIDIETVSGDTELFIPENGGFKAKKNSVSGSLNSNFGGTITKNEMTYKNGGAQFFFDGVSGSVTINKLGATV